MATLRPFSASSSARIITSSIAFLPNVVQAIILYNLTMSSWVGN